MERGFYHPSRGYWQTTGSVPEEILAGYPEGTVEVPLKPDAGAVWTGAAWVAHVETEADKEARRGAARASAVITKGVFCSALMRAGLLSKAEAVAAAKGEWPASFAAFTAALPEDLAAEAEIKWAAAVEVHYADPLLQMLALHVGGGNPESATVILDGMFGLDGPQ